MFAAIKFVDLKYSFYLCRLKFIKNLFKTV
jgi:hypothetical protein